MSGARTPSPDALYAQAFALHRDGRREAARGVLDALLVLAPDHAAGRNLAGVACLQRRDYAGAAEHLRRAAAATGQPGVLVNLGLALQGAGRRAEAAAAYARALRADPALALAWQKLAALHELEGRADEALEAYRRAVALDPGDLKSLGQAVALKRYLCRWDGSPGADDLVAAFRAASRSDCPPWLLLALPEADAALQAAAAATFARSQWGAALARPPLAGRPVRATGRRLRVGYLSADFRTHAVSFLALETIAAHDREAVHVSLYGYGPGAEDAGDPWRRAAAEAGDQFVDLSALDDEQAAARIARDRPDVLVDLTGYTRHGRPGILAYRPAPVIAGWLGYIGTLGEPRLADFAIGDRIAMPPAIASHFSESPAWMPGSFQPNGRLRPLPPPPARRDEGLPADGLVFCSFNQAYKLHPALWDDWCGILRGVPGSVLWLAPPRHPEAVRNLRREAVRRGVAGDRIVFAARRNRDEHLARVPLADLALDTWPYNSGTTGSDALRMGVPLLGFAGDTFAGRMAASLLHAVGLPDCVAPSREGCVRLAIALGNDAPRRDALARRLAARLPAASLFDPRRQAADLERLLHAMHAARAGGMDGPVAVPGDA